MLSKLLHFFNILLIIPSIICVDSEFCDLLDEDCVTTSNRILLKKVIEGIPKLNVPNSDPLHQDIIRISKPEMNVTLSNVNMHGTKGCDIHRFRFNKDDWVFSMLCPKYILKSDYEINGDVASVHIEGKGQCEIVYDNYLIGLYGGYNTITGEDGKVYMNITSIKKDFIDVLGKVVYKFTNLFEGDNEKSAEVHKYINSNWKKIDDVIGDSFTFSLMDHFMDNIKKFIKVVPFGELFPKSNILSKFT